MKDLFGVEMKVGDWFVHASPNNMPVGLRWGIVTGITRAGNIKYAETYFSNWPRTQPAEPKVDMLINAEWDRDLGRYVEVGREIHIRRLKRAGEAVWIVPEDQVPAELVSVWNHNKHMLEV